MSVDPPSSPTDHHALYQLALAVGTSLDLTENTATFLRALLATQGFSAAAVWVCTDQLPRPAGQPPGPSLLQHVHGVPAVHPRSRSLPAVPSVSASNSNGNNRPVAGSPAARSPRYSL